MAVSDCVLTLCVCVLCSLEFSGKAKGGGVHGVIRLVYTDYSASDALGVGLLCALCHTLRCVGFEQRDCVGLGKALGSEGLSVHVLIRLVYTDYRAWARLNDWHSLSVCVSP